MAKFRKKHTLVEAVQLRWDTWSTVCTLIDAPGGIEAGNPEGCYIDATDTVTDDTNGRIGLKIPAAGPPGTYVLAVENDWIVKDESGKLFPLSQAAFMAEFEPAYNHEQYSVDYKPDWDRYPNLAKVFEHRPSINIYWDDLRALLVDARADAVQYVHDVRAEEIMKARDSGREESSEKVQKRLICNVTNVLLKYDVMLELWPPKTMKIHVRNMTGASMEALVGGHPESGEALHAALRKLHGRREKTEYELTFFDVNSRVTRGRGRIEMPDTLGAQTEAGSVRELTDPQLLQALKNVGCDLECGGCAELFFTGTRVHEHTCPKGR